MPSEIVPRGQFYPNQIDKSGMLDQVIRSMRTKAEIAIVAIDLGSAIYRYTNERVASTLEAAELAQQAYGANKPGDKAFFEYSRNLYLGTATHIATRTANELTRVIIGLPAHIDTRSSGRRFLDDLSAELFGR